jgi:hypothetical protein
MSWGSSQAVGREMNAKMARAFEELPIGVPVRDVAPGMNTYGRVGDDAVGGVLLRFAIEAFRVKAQQQYLVEPRAVAHDVGRRVHRPPERLLAVRRQIVPFQRLGRIGPDCNQQIAFARPLVRLDSGPAE